METTTCPHCGQEHPAETRFCPKNGLAITGTSKSICPSCGKEIEATWKVCAYCGKAIHGIEVEKPTVSGRKVKKSNSILIFAIITFVAIILIGLGTLINGINQENSNSPTSIKTNQFIMTDKSVVFTETQQPTNNIDTSSPSNQLTPTPIPTSSLNQISSSTQIADQKPTKIFNRSIPQWVLLGRPGGYAGESSKHGQLAISQINSNYQYVALRENGLLISIDGGHSWTNAYRGLALHTLTNNIDVAQVATDPISESTVYIVVNNRVFVSRDAGQGWTPLADGIFQIGIAADAKTLYLATSTGLSVLNNDNQVITPSIQSPEYSYGAQITVDCQDPSIAYVLANGKMLVTNSLGKQWTTPSLFTNLSFDDVITDQTITGLAYAITSDKSLYRTSDGGRSWALVSDLRSMSDEWYPLVKLWQAKNGTIYISGKVPGEEDYCHSGIFHSFDQGLNWISGNYLPYLLTSIGSFQCPYIDGIAIDSQENNSLYALVNYNNLLYWATSMDNGGSWSLQSPLNEPQSLSVSDNGQVIFISGWYAALSQDGGLTWKDISNALYTDNETFFEPLGFNKIMQAPGNPGTAYLSITNDYHPFIFKTNDSGNSWQSLNIPSDTTSNERRTLVLKLSPNRQGSIYISSPNIFSKDDGESWSSWPAIGNKTIFDITINPANPDNIFFGCADGLYWSQDEGKTISIRGLGPDFTVVKLAFVPNNELRIYAVVSLDNLLGLYRSDDEGVTWQPVSQFMEVNDFVERQSTTRLFYNPSFVVDPKNPSTLYFAFGEIWRSLNGGQSWELFDLGMSPNEDIRGLEISEDTSTLYAIGTSGIWKVTTVP
jgi:photosystem II stability/assembly factor-like uncharacterized protein